MRLYGGKCRLCGIWDNRVLLKYAVRHYVHPDCAIKKWGAEFLNRLTPWQVEHQFPVMVAQRFGIGEQLLARIKGEKVSPLHPAS